MRRSGDRLVRSTVVSGTTIRGAMRALSSGAAGVALLVDRRRRLLGICTDGDLRRALLRGRGLDDPVDPHISRCPVTVGPQADRTAVLDLMRARSVQAVPITDRRGRLIGLHLLREILGAVERPHWAVLMAGGRGTRLGPVAEVIPKPMISVAGRPILERLVLHLVGYGIRRIFLAVHYLSPKVEEHFGDGRAFGCRIVYLREQKPLGTAGALSLLRPRPRDPLIVMNGDLVTDVDVSALLRFHHERGLAATVGLRDYVHHIPFGVVALRRDRVVGIEEKPAATWGVSAGIYVLDPKLLAWIPPRAPMDMPELLGRVLARGKRVGSYQIEGDWHDIARMADLRRIYGEEEAT